MTTQNTWSSPKHMVDWFNQLDNPDDVAMQKSADCKNT